MRANAGLTYIEDPLLDQVPQPEHFVDVRHPLEEQIETFADGLLLVARRKSGNLGRCGHRVGPPLRS
jgi:hypothetical protein